MTHEEFEQLTASIVEHITMDANTVMEVRPDYNAEDALHTISLVRDLEAAYTNVEMGLTSGGEVLPTRDDLLSHMVATGVPYLPSGISNVEASTERLVEILPEDLEIEPEPTPVPEEIDMNIVNIDELPPNENLTRGLAPVGTPTELEWFIQVLKGDNPNGWVMAEIEDRSNGEVGRGAWHIRFFDNFERTKSFWITNVWYNRFCEVESLGLTPIEIPENIVILEANSGTLTVDESTSRFSGAIWYEELQKQKVTLAGVGGIGSYVGFLLARMKPYVLYIYDPDVVETVNMSGQLYSIEDVGVNKTTALARMVNKYANYSSVATYGRFEATSEATDIMICGFDNMSARNVFYSRWKAHVSSKPAEDRHKCLLIDGRLAAEEFQVITITGEDERAMREYEHKWLFGDAEADATVCSYKQTTFMANMIASVMVNTFVNFVANLCEPIFPRDIPFIVTYDASTMFFKTEM